VVAAHVMTR
jgi:hypothetical protein